MPRGQFARFREYRQPPPVVSGYPLDNYRVSFYKPRAAVNLIANPSIELDTTGYTAVGSTIAQSALKQRFGVYSLEVTPTSATSDGAYYGTFDLASGQLYIASLYGYFPAGHKYKLYFANTSGTLLGTAYEFRGRGRWERVSVAYLETSTASRRLYVTKNGDASALPFYIDGLQVEADVLTSYIDGDQRGYVSGQQAYYWNGTPHASTSVRVLGTRAGGQEVFLTDYGFSILALVGLGLSGFSNLATPNVYVGGSQYESTVYTERSFDIVGTFQADTPAYLQQLRSDLGSVLRPNAGIITQPLTLRIQTLDDCGNVRGEVVEIACVLEPSSLAGSWNNYFQDPVTLSFTTYLPYLAAQEGNDGAELDYQNTLTGVGSILQRSPTGAWSGLGAGAASGGLIRSVVVAPNGYVYAGGGFATLDGVTGTTRIGYWDGNAWNAMGTGAGGGDVYDLAVTPDGNIVAVGSFTSMNSVSNTSHIALWNTTTNTWSSISSSFTGTYIYTCKYDGDGNLYVGGKFSVVGAQAMANVGYRTAAGTWTAMDSGLGTANVDQVLAVIPLSTSLVYAGGDFTAPENRVAVWDGSAWSDVGGGLGADVYAMGYGVDGSLYAAGEQLLGIQKYSGSAWTRIATITGPGTPQTLMIEVDANNVVYFGFSSVEIVNRLPIAGGFITYVNGTFLGFSEVTSATVYSMATKADGSLIIAGQFSDATVAPINTIENEGSADSYPVFTMVGPGTVYELRNYTTGDGLQFDLTLLDGETATLTLGPGNISFVSSVRGNILGTIMAGSSLATFRVVPGDNSVSAFIAGTTSSDTRLKAYWDTLYLSFDDALYKP